MKSSNPWKLIIFAMLVAILTTAPLAIADDIDPDAVSVELYAEPQKEGDPIAQVMTRGECPAEATDNFTYSASVPTGRPAADYTPRLIPRHPGALVPLEAPFILWHQSPSWR